MGAAYPRIHADLGVTFRAKAPEAKRSRWISASYRTWSVTIPPQVPGSHYCYPNIDGVRVSDPASNSFYGFSRHSSGIEIPEAGVDYYQIKNVPHLPGIAQFYRDRAEAENVFDELKNQ